MFSYQIIMNVEEARDKRKLPLVKYSDSYYIVNVRGCGWKFEEIQDIHSPKECLPRYFLMT